MTFKGVLNEKMPFNCQKNIKKKQELRQSTETIKSALKGGPDYESYFLEYATTLYNQVPKQMQETESYCDVFPKLKSIYLEKH